jgi:hypothetical protein
MTWPGIPNGRGSTCIEEGCGNPKRARGNDCRACYRRKWMQHKRAAEGDPHSWSEGGYEVPLAGTAVRDLDAAQYREWQRLRDEFT